MISACFSPPALRTTLGSKRSAQLLFPQGVRTHDRRLPSTNSELRGPGSRRARAGLPARGNWTLKWGDARKGASLGCSRPGRTGGPGRGSRADGVEPPSKGPQLPIRSHFDARFAGPSPLCASVGRFARIRSHNLRRRPTRLKGSWEAGFNKRSDFRHVSSLPYVTSDHAPGDVTEARSKPSLTARDAPARPECGGGMKVIAFIEPPQGDVIEEILRHCGLWPSTPRPPPAGDAWVHDSDDASNGPTASSDAPREVTFVDMDTFWTTF